MELTQNQGADALAAAVWDERSFADVLTDSVKVEVESVYTTFNNGFKEIQFYHNNCITGLFVLFVVLNDKCVSFSLFQAFTKSNGRGKNRELKLKSLERAVCISIVA